MKTVIGIVVLGVVVGGIYVLNDVTRTPDGRSRLHVAPELEIPVETARPEVRDIVRTVQAPGTVEAFSEVDISSELVAKILEMPVEEGDYVQAGQLLCRLDDAEYRARVLSAQANVSRLKSAITQAEAEVEKAETDYSQEQRLYELGGTSPDTVAQFRTRLISARAALEMREHELTAAEASHQSALEDLEKTIIRAPLSGIVAQRFAKQGEVVITGTMNNPGTRIMVISDLSKMQVRCRIDEADAPLVAPEQPARIYLQSDTRRSVAGSVLRVGTKGTKPTGRDVVTFETLVLITANDPRVKPGMTANVEIEVARKERALTIPVQAVVYRKRRDLPEALVKEHDALRAAEDPAARQNIAEYIRIVFSMDDGKAHPHLITTGINDATSVEVVSGLPADRMIVVGPYRSLDQLKDGSAIKTVDKPGVATTQPASPAAGEEAAPTTAPSRDEPNDADENA